MAVLIMIRPVPYIWQKLGSINLTVALCLMLTADLSWGFLCLNRRTSIFAPLNDIGLAAWIETYGRSNLIYTAWFFILLFLLFLLGLNTFICTTERVIKLARSRRHFTPSHLAFRFAPHIMHYALLIILAGYLSSYLFARVLDTQVLVPGSSIKLPGHEARIKFTSFEPEYYEGDRLPAFKNRVLKPVARLLFVEDGREEPVFLSYNAPVKFKGHYIHLKDFSPKSKNPGISRRIRIDLSIRKDPGTHFYLAGILLFNLGLVMYLTEWIFFKKKKKDIS